MKKIGEDWKREISSQRSTFCLKSQADSRKLRATFTRNLKLSLLAFAVFLFSALPTWAGLNKESIKPKLAKLGMPFIENQGQIKDTSVKFYANTFAGTVFLTEKGEIVYSLKSKVGETKQSQRFMLRNSKVKTSDPGLIKGWVIREKLEGFKCSKVQGIDKAETQINYFVGNKKEDWRSGIPSYSSVSLGEIYDGIELKLKAYGNNVEKLFVVNPGADVSKIAVSLEGTKSLKINESGELEIETGLGALKFTKPYAYQVIDGKRIEVTASFVLHDSASNSEPETENRKLTYRFKVALYNKDYPLVIDPLISSTYIGGEGRDEAYSLAIDGSGNVFVTGWTQSGDYPTPGRYGAYDRYLGGGWDVFISKFDSTLSTLLSSTYIGGQGGDIAYSIGIDIAGRVYITGCTNTNFYGLTYPVSLGRTYRTTTGSGGADVFISKFNNNLTTLLASAVIGTEGEECAYSLAIGSGYVYVTGLATDPSFPIVGPTYDRTLNGNDAFIARLNSSDLRLTASTFLGGPYTDWASSIAVDRGNVNVYIAGQTEEGFPTTRGAYNTTWIGDRDGFIARLDANLTTLISSTYLGGSGWDSPSSIALDSSDNVYVTGETASSDFPTTAGAYDRTYNGGDVDVFISRLDSNLSSNYLGTFIGGSGDDDIGENIPINIEPVGPAIIVAGGSVYVSGKTNSNDFPTTTGAYDWTYNGGGDAFVSRLDADLSRLTSSTFIGGGEADKAYSLAIGRSGYIYVAGAAGANYPTTTPPPPPYDSTYNGWGDVFVSSFTADLSLVSAVCGNGFLEPGEACDDGNNINGDGCSAVCEFEPLPFDYGDAPDPTYPSRLSSNGARHSYFTPYGFGDNYYLGRNITYESDSNQVDRDQFDDGLVSRSPISVTVSGSWGLGFTLQTLYLNILIDRDGDGDWNDANEWAVQNFRIPAGSSLGVFTPDPSLSLPDNAWMRITLTVQQPLSNYNGSWPQPFLGGETEDYIFRGIDPVKKINKHEYHFKILQFNPLPVNDSLVFVTIWDRLYGWTGPVLQDVKSNLFPFWNSWNWGLWQWVNFWGIPVPYYNWGWFNVSFRGINGPIAFSTAFFVWTGDNIPVGPWIWLGWRITSPYALYNHITFPDDTLNTNDLVVRNIQFASSPTRLSNDETTLDNPLVEHLFTTSPDPLRPGAFIVNPGNELTITPEVNLSDIPYPEVGGRTVLVKGEILVSSGGGGGPDEWMPFVIQFIAEEVATIPEPFTFTARTGVSLDALITSNSITISGIDTSVPISITDGEYSVNEGEFTPSSGTVNNGDIVRVRQTSAGSYSTTTNSTLTIGGVSGTFSITTLPSGNPSPVVPPGAGVGQCGPDAFVTPTVGSTITGFEVQDISTFMGGLTGRVYIDWGDGSAMEIIASGATSGLHTYANPGTYKIRKTTQDDQFGFNCWKEAEVKVSDLASGGFGTINVTANACGTTTGVKNVNFYMTSGHLQFHGYTDAAGALTLPVVANTMPAGTYTLSVLGPQGMTCYSNTACNTALPATADVPGTLAVYCQ